MARGRHRVAMARRRPGDPRGRRTAGRGGAALARSRGRLASAAGAMRGPSSAASRTGGTPDAPPSTSSTPAAASRAASTRAAAPPPATWRWHDVRTRLRQHPAIRRFAFGAFERLRLRVRSRGRGRAAAGTPPVVGAMTRTAVDGIVLAAGRGERLGLGPKAWLTLGGRTLLERAVATMRLVADRVTVGVDEGDVERARAVCGADVRRGGGRRHSSRDDGGRVSRGKRARGARARRRAPVPHARSRPARARRCAPGGAAVAAVRDASSAYHAPRDGARSRLGPGTVWLVRRPFAFRRADFARGLDSGRRRRRPERAPRARGRPHATRPAPPWHIKVTTAEDWSLAQAIERQLRPG